MNLLQLLNAVPPEAVKVQPLNQALTGIEYGGVTDDGDEYSNVTFGTTHMSPDDLVDHPTSPGDTLHTGEMIGFVIWIKASEYAKVHP